MSTSSEDRSKTWQTIGLILIQLLMLLTLVVWALAAFLLGNIYEGGATAEKHLIFLPIFIYPLAVMAASIAAWVNHLRGRGRPVLLLLAPLLYGGCYFLYFILMAQSF